MDSSSESREDSTEDPRRAKTANSDAVSSHRGLVWIQPTPPRVPTAISSVPKTTSFGGVVCCLVSFSAAAVFFSLLLLLTSSTTETKYNYKCRNRFYLVVSTTICFNIINNYSTCHIILQSPRTVTVHPDPTLSLPTDSAFVPDGIVALLKI